MFVVYLFTVMNVNEVNKVGKRTKWPISDVIAAVEASLVLDFGLKPEFGLRLQSKPETSRHFIFALIRS